MATSAMYLHETTQKILTEHADRASGLAKRIDVTKPGLCSLGRPSRGSVVRLALERGLQSLERDCPPVGAVGSAGS